ncbi:MAG: YraN family protein [Candidatus Uhrbacteria bacterium]|nr:YraN family protein [Candidatus Uhrbacteria bacterium]
MASKKKSITRTPTPRQQIGRRGEELAARFLIQRGYEVVERNWRCGRWEADIIVQKKGEVRIVEVKTRRSMQVGFPEESVTGVKFDRLWNLALIYAERKGISDDALHVDVITIDVNTKGRATLRYLVDVG